MILRLKLLSLMMGKYTYQKVIRTRPQDAKLRTDSGEQKIVLKILYVYIH